MFLIPLFLLSCNDEEYTSFESKSRILCTVDEFIPDTQSRTNTDPNNNFRITWASGDVIGIFPYEGYQEPFAIPANQVDSTFAAFDGGYWSMREGLRYGAYYPFDKANFESEDMKTKIPVTYVGQRQNGTSCDIGAFDYTYSEWKTPVAGNVTFSFKHIGGIGIFSLKYPATTTYTSMTLSVEDALIPLKGSYNMKSENVSFVADNESKSKSISLALDNCSGVAGEIGTFYIMLPPMDLSNCEVTLTLESSAGTTCSYSIEKALNVTKGKLYRRTGVPKESSVGGTVEGWIEEEENNDMTPYVTFTAEATQTFTMSKAVETLEYSVNNGEWKILGTNTVTFGGTNGTLRLRGKSLIGTANSIDDYSQISFGNETFVACSGDIRTLIDYENYDTTNTKEARYCYLFKNCSVLVSAPELPAMNLADYCYYGMFQICTNLSIAPKLPAMNLEGRCYGLMFSGCNSLITAPQLPATNLAAVCYTCMFKDCVNLTTAPVLPATILGEACYQMMFENCTNLTKTPDLPATTLAVACYYMMYKGCTNLVNAPQLPATNLAPHCYESMFHSCTSIVKAPTLSATKLTDYCYAYMFYNCSNLNNITMLATNVSAEYCLNKWTFGLPSSGTFTKAKDVESLYISSNGIPSGWTIVDYKE